MSAAAAPAAGAATSAPAPANGAASNSQAPAPGTTTPTPAPEAGKPTASAPKTEAQKIKLKLRSKKGETDREYTPAELERELQIAEHERGQRAQYLAEKKEFDDRMRRLSEDTDAFLEEAGFDFEAYTQRRTQRMEQLKAMSPEARENQALKEKLARIEEAEAKRAESERVAGEERKQQEFVQSNVRLYDAAMKLAGLKPSDPGAGSFLRNMAIVRELAHHSGEPDYSPEQMLAQTERFELKQFTDMAARLAKNETWRGRNAEGLQALARSLIPQLEGDALLNWLGKETAIRVTKALHAHTRTSPVPIIQEPPPVGVQTQTSAAAKPQRTEWDILDGLGG